MILPASAFPGAPGGGVPTYPPGNPPNDFEQAIGVQGDAFAESGYELPSFSIGEIIGEYPSTRAAVDQYAQARRKLSGACGNEDGLPATLVEPVTLAGLGDDAMEWPRTLGADRAETFLTTTVVIRRGRYLVLVDFYERRPGQTPPPPVPAAEVTSISRLAVSRVPG
jgi:hypothetical protein